MNHKQVAIEILDAVGGKDNVSSLTHCITRLRFKLKNTETPKKEELEKIDGVIQVIEKGGQYQVVIGKEVEPVFDEVIKLIGVKKEENEEDGNKGTLFDKFTSLVTGVLLPTMGVLTACGMIKGLLTVLAVAKVLPTDSETYQVLSAIGDTLFYFFPVILGASTAIYFKMNQYLGMAIGAAMVHPIIIGIATNGAAISFLGLPMTLTNYSSTVFPVIVSVWAASKLSKLLNKFVPQGLKFFLVPLIVLLTIVPLTFFVVGPVVTFLSSLLSKGTFAVYNFSPVLAALVLGGPWLIVVMFGLHWAFIPIFINNVLNAGGDPVMGLLGANMFAVIGSCFAIALKTRDMKLRQLSISSGIACILGVSEPAIYGVLLPYKKTFITTLIAGSLGAVFPAIFGTKVYTFAAAGIFAIPGYLNPKGIGMDFYGGVASLAAGLIFGFALTYFFGYKSSDNVSVSKKSDTSTETKVVQSTSVDVKSD